jgi:non-ribosomal peptide synthetase component F
VLVKSQGVFPAIADVLESFEHCVDEHAARPAIVHNGQIISYAAIGARVAATAEGLGAQPGVVGVLSARDPGTIVGLLGTLAAGGVYCPVDPAYPEPRQRSMLVAAAGDRILAARPGLRAPAGYRVAVVPDRNPGIPTVAPFPAAVDDPAYILFTSGSSGRPNYFFTPRGAIASTGAPHR